MDLLNCHHLPSNLSTSVKLFFFTPMDNFTENVYQISFDVEKSNCWAMIRFCFLKKQLLKTTFYAPFFFKIIKFVKSVFY